MAEYRVSYKSDGSVNHELFYKRNIFMFNMIPDEYGKTSDRKGFAYQVLDEFDDESEEVVEAVGNLVFAEEDEIEEILDLLSWNEN